MKIPRWLRWRSRAELDEEIEAHLDFEIRANLARGLSPAEARFAAQRRFGNATVVNRLPANATSPSASKPSSPTSATRSEALRDRRASRSPLS